MLIECNYSGITDPAIDNGRDLTKIFRSEINGYADEWQWIKDRIKHVDFKDIHYTDYLPLTVNGETHQMQAGGIDTYFNTTDQPVPHHIDFISRDCYSQAVQWNTTNNNNGVAGNEHPYLASNVYRFLENLYNQLPEKTKAVIKNKRTLLEKRYSAAGALSDSTNWGWADAGKLWLPTEYEVYGSVVWGTKGWSVGQAVQYPIFANSWRNRLKGDRPGGSRCSWWLASAGGGFVRQCLRCQQLRQCHRLVGLQRRACAALLPHYGIAA